MIESTELIYTYTYGSTPARAACYSAHSDSGRCTLLSRLICMLSFWFQQRSSTAGCSTSSPRSWRRTAGDSSRRRRETCTSPRCSPWTWAATCAKWRTLWPTPGSWAHQHPWLWKQMVRYYTRFTLARTRETPLSCMTEPGWMPRASLGRPNWWINTVTWSPGAIEINEMKLSHS